MPDADIYTPNEYSYELNPEMMKRLAEEFDVDKATAEFAKATKGKSADEIDAEGKTFFGNYGKNWIQQTHKLGDEYPDRTYEVLKMAIDKTGGHLKFALLPQRFLEIAYLSTQELSVLPIIENNPKRLVYRLPNCTTYEKLKENCGEETAKRLPCRHACITACETIHRDLDIDAKVEMSATIPADGHCEFSVQRA